MTRYNCHMHYLNHRIVPLGMLHLGSNDDEELIKKCLDGDFSGLTAQDDDSSGLLAGVNARIRAVAQFVENDPAGYLSHLLDVYKNAEPDSDWCFCLLTINFDHAVDDYAPTFYRQLRQALMLKKHFPIMVFMGIDPRDKSIAKLSKDRLQQLGIDGFKVYPPLGFYPSDDNLDPVFALAEEMGLPVTAHCSFPHNVRYHRREPLRWADPTNDRAMTSLLGRMTAPAAWVPVLQKHKNLRVNLAHFGDPLYPDFWTDEIIDMMGSYNNLYADISYCHNCLHQTAQLMKDNVLLQSRLLFGSDYFLDELGGQDEGDLLVRVKEVFGKNLFDRLTKDNPQAFLFGHPQ